MNEQTRPTHRSIARFTAVVATIIGCLFLFASPAISGEDAPALSHGTIFENYVNVTLRSAPTDHCILFWGITNFRMTYNFPNEIGGPVDFDLAPAFPFATTLDGRIALNNQGVWSFQLPCLTEIRTLVGKIYFQAVSFRVEGSRIIPTASKLLEIDISTPTNPKSNLRRALDLLKKNQEKSQDNASDSYGRTSLYRVSRFSQNQNTNRYDPFARRVIASRRDTR
jgi:hypothetical protein